jgi:uncharacterized protein involved in exopolysaccharide biosynthesis
VNHSPGRDSAIPPVIVVQTAPIDDSDAINIVDVFSVLWRGRWLMLLSISALTFAFGLHAWLARPVYRAAALIVVANSQGGDRLDGMGSARALAQVAGIDLGGTESRRAEYVSMLTSRSLAREFIEKENLMPLLFPSRWRSDAHMWTTTWLHPSPPTLGQAVAELQDRVLRIADDQDTGLITVSMEMPSRERAAELTNSLIALVNQRVRAKEIERSKHAIDYLNAELQRTSAVGIRDGIFRLMEANLNRIMMANVEEQFAFRIVDAAITPEPGNFVRPQRMLQLLAGFALGTLLGMVIALWRGRSHWLSGRTAAAPSDV